jgi:hypothetical protein
MKQNYKKSWDKQRGKFVKTHRLVMEKSLGRSLSYLEVVHHIDGNIKNNNINNLVVMSLEEHTSMHCAGKRKKT